MSNIKIEQTWKIQFPTLTPKYVKCNYNHFHIECDGVTFLSKIKEDITAYELCNMHALMGSLNATEYTAEDIKQTMSDLGILRHFEISHTNIEGE